MLMEGIHARSISYRMKKNLGVDATLYFQSQGHFQGQDIKHVEKMTKKINQHGKLYFLRH